MLHTEVVTQNQEYFAPGVMSPGHSIFMVEPGPAPGPLLPAAAQISLSKASVSLHSGVAKWIHIGFLSAATVHPN